MGFLRHLVDVDALAYCRYLEGTGSPGAIHMAQVIRSRVYGRLFLGVVVYLGVGVSLTSVALLLLM